MMKCSFVVQRTKLLLFSAGLKQPFVYLHLVWQHNLFIYSMSREKPNF